MCRKRFDGHLADLGVELPVVLVLDPDLCRVVQDAEREIRDVLQHGQEAPLDLAPEAFFLGVLIRRVRQGRLVDDTQAGEPLRRGATGVGLLDATGQRALAANRHSARVGRRRPRQQPRREDELVLRPQGVARRWNLGGHDGRGEGATSIAGPGRGHWLHLGCQVGHVHAKDSVVHVVESSLVAPRRAATGPCHSARGCLCRGEASSFGWCARGLASRFRGLPRRRLVRTTPDEEVL